MKMIELTTSTGPVCVNVQAVAYIMPAGTGTRLVMAGGYELRVTEGYTRLMSLLMFREYQTK